MIVVPPGDALIPASLAAKMIAQAERRCWAEGYDAGYMDGPDEWTTEEEAEQYTRNPYDTDGDEA